MLAGLILCSAAIAPAAAQEPQDTARRETPPADTIFRVEEIKVRVARPIATAGGAAAITTVLDSVRATPSPTLADVLRRLPLIQVRENSRGEAQPTMRGMESRRIAILVDGVPLTLGWDNRTDLSVIPLTAARRLTLVRGLSSVLYGPNALGGVLLVAVGEGADDGAEAYPPAVRLNAGMDDLGNSALSLGVSTVVYTASGEALLRAGGGYRNRSAYPRPAGVDPALPGQGDDRVNSDLEHTNAYVSARYQSDGGAWYSLSSFGFVAERGVPPELHVEDPRLWRYPKTSRWVTALSAGTGWKNTPWGQGDLEASVGLDFGETDIDTYASLAYDSITGGETGDDRTLSFRLLGDHTLGPGVLRGALTLAESRHIGVIDDGDPATYKQRLWSLGLEVEQPILGAGAESRARVSAGFSLDGADTPETGGAPPRDPIGAWGARVGGTLIVGDGDLLLNGGVSRRVRFPALRELYSGALGKFVVNTGLDPEVLGVAELGATFRVEALEAQVVTFYQRLTDAIVRVGLGGGKLQRQNRDEITSLGIELLFDATLGPLSLAGDLTLQNVELKDPTAEEEQQLQAEYQPWLNGGLGIRAPLGRGLWTGARVRHIAQRYCVNSDLDAEVRLDSDTWLDLELGAGFDLGGAAARRLEALFAFDNVTDASVFDQCGLPRPGRLVRFMIQIF